MTTGKLGSSGSGTQLQIPCLTTPYAAKQALACPFQLGPLPTFPASLQQHKPYSLCLADVLFPPPEGLPDSLIQPPLLSPRESLGRSEACRNLEPVGCPRGLRFPEAQTGSSPLRIACPLSRGVRVGARGAAASQSPCLCALPPGSGRATPDVPEGRLDIPSPSPGLLLFLLDGIKPV